jgi:hypothetical protein
MTMHVNRVPLRMRCLVGDVFRLFTLANGARERGTQVWQVLRWSGEKTNRLHENKALNGKLNTYRLDEAGLRDVWLASGYTIRMNPDGMSVTIENVVGLTQAICRALAGKPGRLARLEFHNLRLRLGLSQKSLATACGNTEQAIVLLERKYCVSL